MAPFPFTGADGPKEDESFRLPLLGSKTSFEDDQSKTSSPLKSEKLSYRDSDPAKSSDDSTVGEDEDDEDEDVEEEAWSYEPRPTSRWKATRIWKWVLVILSVVVGCISGIFFATTSARRPSFSTLEKALVIPEFKHWGDASRVRNHVLWGPGLEKAVQNEESIFYIDFADKDGLNTTTTPSLPQDEDIYVLLSGPAMLSAKVTYVSEGRYVVKYRVFDAGVYNLRVDVFKRAKIMREPIQYWLPLGQAGGYEVVAVRRDGSRVPGDGRQTIDMPKQVCPTVEEAGEGRWIRCEDVGAPCVRWGWIYVPRDCYYEILSPEEVKNKPFWIMILGTSVKRGTFFAAIDYLLGEAAANLSTSTFWKCWGWMDLQFGKFRISYLDYRRQCYAPQAICGSANYSDAAKEMFGKLGSDNGGPDIVLLEINENYMNTYEGLGPIREAFGPNWKGVALAGFRAKSPERAWKGWYPDSSEILKQSIQGHPQLGFQFQDLSFPSEPFYDQMEFPLAKNTSFHWHHQCDENNMHVCSPIPDMEFQTLMSYMKRLPDRENFVHSPHITTIDNTTVVPGEGTKFCMQCPKGLDFSMRPNATVTCYEEIPKYGG